MSDPPKPAAPAALTERERAENIAAILTRFEATPIFKRLRVRIRDLGDDQRDEVVQFQQLQKACRESKELAAAFIDAGLGDIAKANARAPDAATGAVIQAFNRFVETRWED